MKITEYYCQCWITVSMLNSNRVSWNTVFFSSNKNKRKIKEIQVKKSSSQHWKKIPESKNLLKFVKTSLLEIVEILFRFLRKLSSTVKPILLRSFRFHFVYVFDRVSFFRAKKKISNLVNILFYSHVNSIVNFVFFCPFCWTTKSQFQV